MRANLYHIHGVGAYRQRNAGRESIVDARADDQVSCVPQTALEFGGWRPNIIELAPLNGRDNRFILVAVGQRSGHFGEIAVTSSNDSIFPDVIAYEGIRGHGDVAIGTLGDKSWFMMGFHVLWR